MNDMIFFLPVFVALLGVIVVGGLIYYGTVEEEKISVCVIETADALQCCLDSEYITSKQSCYEKYHRK